MTFSFFPLSSIPEKLAISNFEVHFWTIFLDRWVENLSSLSDHLDIEELSRAARFRRERDRQRFMIRRILLKKLLGLYLGTNPQMIRFNYGCHGKPYLSGGTPLQFNMSHSQGLAVFVVSRRRQLGVDLESLEVIPEIDALLSRWLPPREARSLQKLPNQPKHLAFYRLWTQKEAYLKALGIGLGGPQNIINFFPKDLESARQNSPGELSRVGIWSFQVLTPAPNFVATVAVEGDDYRLHCLQWKAEIDIQPDLFC